MIVEYSSRAPRVLFDGLGLPETFGVLLGVLGGVVELVACFFGELLWPYTA